MSLPVFLCRILKYIIINSITTITDYVTFIIIIIVI